MLEKITDELWSGLSGVNASTIVIIVVLLLIGIIVWIVKNRKDIKGVWDWIYNKRKKEEEQVNQLNTLVELTQNLSGRIDSLVSKVDDNAKRLDNLESQTKDNCKHISTYEDNRVHDRQQSLNKQRAIDEHFDELRDILKEVQVSVTKMREKSDIQECANLKDRISRLYRECKDEKKWTKMQKETMEDMIKSYELSPNGQNSFVHTVVQAEMYTWDIVEED